jgi:hypothetical protein
MKPTVERDNLATLERLEYQWWTAPLVFVPRHFVGLLEEWTNERIQLFETMWREEMMETLAPSFCRVSQNRAILENFLRPAPGESRKVHCAFWATPPAEHQFHARLFSSA